MSFSTGEVLHVERRIFHLSQKIFHRESAETISGLWDIVCKLLLLVLDVVEFLLVLHLENQQGQRRGLARKVVCLE